MRVTFIRHAESTHNATGDEGPNSPLSERGMQQARELKGSYDLVIVSPLRRTMQTYANSKIEAGYVLVTPSVRETTPLGIVCNHLENETPQKESAESITQRVAGVFRFLQSRSEKTICVITHHDFAAEFSKLINKGKPISLPNAGNFSFTLT